MTPVIYSFDIMNGDLTTLSAILAYATIEKIDYEVLPGFHKTETYSGIRFNFVTEEDAMVFKLKFPI